MFKKVKLTPNERALIVSPINRYRVVGPGKIWLKPRQQHLITLYVGPKGKQLIYENVRTAENIPLKITVQLLYQANENQFTKELLPKLEFLGDGGWENILHWQTEYVLRKLVANYTWQELGYKEVQERIERQLAQTLADRVKMVGLNVNGACLLKTELPDNLQQTLVETEANQIETRGRAAILKDYFEIFGDNLAQALPQIVQWELLNTLQKTNPQVLLSAANLTAEGVLPRPTLALAQQGDSPPKMYQVQLPLQ